MRKIRFDKVDGVTLLQACMLLVTSQDENDGQLPSQVYCSHIDYYLAHYAGAYTTIELRPDDDVLFTPRSEIEQVRGHRFLIVPSKLVPMGVVMLG